VGAIMLHSILYRAGIMRFRGGTRGTWPVFRDQRCRLIWVGVAVLGVITAMCIDPGAEAYAHARWFLVNDTIPSTPPLVLDHLYGVVIACAIAFVIALLLADRLSATSRVLNFILHQPVRSPQNLDWRLLSVAFGTTLIINSMTSVFLAPNLQAGPGFIYKFVMFLQIIAGAVFVIQSHLVWAGLGVLLLPISCWWLFSFGEAVDYSFELGGVGLALLLMAPSLSITQPVTRTSGLQPGKDGGSPGFTATIGSIVLGRYAPAGLKVDLTGPDCADARERWAASILRVTLGLQLMVLSAHDKLIDPAVSLAFVNKYSFVNVPAMLGATGFSNMHFVVAAGIGELAMGGLLVSHIATRLVSSILLAIFLTTGAVFGIEELVGHLPIAAALVVLITAGSSKVRRTSARGAIDRRAFIAAASASVCLVIAAFVLNRTPAYHPIPMINSASVPAVLYKHFAAESRMFGFQSGSALAHADEAVRSAFEMAGPGHELDKTELAWRLFDLLNRYENTRGADTASQWLRYAILTASCSHDDLQTFRYQFSSDAWRIVIATAPADLVRELMPIARNAAAAILKREVDGTDRDFWRTVANEAPASGGDYTYTHTLASIARILTSAARDRESWITTAAR